MSVPLPLRVAPLPRETLPSFISRLAAVNGASTTDFAVDMGFAFKRVLEMDEVAIAALATISGISLGQLEALKSWTGVRAGNVRMAFRDEVFVSRALRNPKVRGCPICLQEDAKAHRARPIEAMAMRGDWQFREVSICVRHRHPLVQLWDVSAVSQRFDIGTQLERIQDDIFSGKLDQPLITPSAYDLWLDARLDDGTDATWLAEQSLFAATTFCRLLGAELLRLGNHGDPDEFSLRRAAQSEGFSIASKGEAAICNALDALASHTLETPRKTYGQLYVKLASDYLNEDSFALFRRLFRDRILTIWPVAPGEKVLGEVVEQRRLHSISTAMQETGINAGLLERFLIEAGAVAPDDNRPIGRKTFDAVRFADLLKELPTLVGPIEMQNAMGATKIGLVALESDGILSPRTRLTGIRSPWSLADGLALVDEIRALAQAVAADDREWEAIQLERRRTRISVGTIIAAIRRGDIRVGQRDGQAGYRSFVVLKSEVDRLVPAIAAKEDSELTPAAAFARTIGLREGGKFLSFLAEGYTPSVRIAHPRTGVKLHYMSEADKAAFHERFLTLTSLAAELGQHRNAVAAMIRAAGIMPFVPNGRDFGAIYLRTDLGRILGPGRDKPTRA